MICGRGPTDNARSTARRACVSEKSLTWIFRVSAEMVVPEPDGGGGGGGVLVVVLPAATVIESRLKPGWSTRSVMTCFPALSVTGRFAVVQFCQPPVAGTDTVVQTPLWLKPTCSRPPPLGDATRSCTV